MPSEKSFEPAEAGITNPGGCSDAVPLGRVANFVRQYAHDVRNHLGAIELQAAFLAELVRDQEAAGEVKRLRVMVSDAVKALQAVSAHFSMPEASLVVYDAALLVEALKGRLVRLCPQESARLVWEVELAGGCVSVDLAILGSALAELVRNASFFQEPTGELRVKVMQGGGRLRIALFEKLRVMPEAPERWGLVPFESSRRGGYGMGLFHARAALALHGGRVSFVCDPAQSQLITEIDLPMCEGTHNGG